MSAPRIDNGDGAHVFFGCEDQFLIDDVLARHAERQRAGRVEEALEASTQAGVLTARTFRRRGVVKQTGTQCLAQHIPVVGAARLHHHAPLLRNVVELRAHFAHFSQCFDMQKTVLWL